jgi:phosphatidate cytidylyltransferase
MSNSFKRIIAALVLVFAGIGIGIAEHFGMHAVKWAGFAVVIAMIIEYLLCLRRAPREVIKSSKLVFGGFLVWLFVMAAAILSVGTRPWIVLLLLLIICGADIGAWFFGRLIGGDKMWERMSAGKTWSGQIAGIVCGTFAGIMYGLLGADTFMPQLMWIGISVSLLSQYGDITASWIKRKLGIKDFGTILPGHGGILDRFDGWIYVLPIVWLIMM